MSGPTNTVVSTFGTGSVMFFPNWTAYPPQYASVSYVATSQAIRFPQTVVNKRRPDGTRPMSAYYKEWFRVVNPGYNQDALPAPSGREDWVYRSTSVPVIPMLPMWTAPSDMGLYWEGVNNDFGFKPRLELSAQNAAKTKVLNKISQKKWDIGVTALELRQTAGLVTDLATGMVKTLDDMIHLKGNAGMKTQRFLRDVVREGDFYKAAEKVGLKNTDFLKRLRDRWMQYQFGVRPLLHDIHDAADLLNQRINADGLSVLVACRAGHESAEIGRTRWIGDLQTGKTEQSVRYREECRVHYSVVYELPTGQVPLYQALGLDNAPSIFWEGTRLSWMYDYAVGTGDWLASFTASSGLIFREGSVSTLRRLISIEVDSRIKPTSYPYTFSKIPNGSGVYLEHGHFHRELLKHGVTPAVVPQIKSKLGLVPLANSLFALSNVLGGKPGLR